MNKTVIKRAAITTALVAGAGSAFQMNRQAGPTAERSSGAIIDISGADFAQILPPGEVIDGVPIGGDAVWGESIRIQIDPYKDYQIHRGEPLKGA